jgi:hypothetical protein
MRASTSFPHRRALAISVLSVLTAAATQAGVPDPTLLPQATTTQTHKLPEYDALGVPGLAHGQFYLDPTTLQKVYKLTDAAFPSANREWLHGYFEGGHLISLPYKPDGTRAILITPCCDGYYWLVDFKPGATPQDNAVVGNARPLPASGSGALNPWTDGAFTFSNKAGTAFYAYVARPEGIYRIDIRDLSRQDGDGWPVYTSQPVWIHQSMDDGMFTWMTAASHNVFAYMPAGNANWTSNPKVYTDLPGESLNEPRIDRGGRYVGISMTTPMNAVRVWDTDTDAVWQAGSTVPFAHQAGLRHRWYGEAYNDTAPFQFSKFDPQASSITRTGGPAASDAIDASGSWIQPDAALDAQWALFCHFGSLAPPDHDPNDPSRPWSFLAPGGMIYVNGQTGAPRYLLAHPYNRHPEYAHHTYAQPSPDGRFVLFTSDMNGYGRSDQFIVEVPTTDSQATPTPTPTPTPGSNPSWTRVEQDNAAVTYTGTWYEQSAAGHSAGTAKTSLEAGARATFTFSGTGIRWIGAGDDWSGIGRVYIDGVAQSPLVDTYLSQGYQRVLFEKTGLTNGTHTIVVEATGTKNAASQTAWIWVDAFEVGTGGATPTPTPTPNPSWTRLEQDNAAVTYTGTWYEQSAAGHSAGTAKTSLEAGARATFTFSGTGIRWIGAGDDWSGIGRVYIDGVAQSPLVDTYLLQGYQRVLFEKTGLTNGTHTIIVEATGTKNAASQTAWIWVDAFEKQ